MCQRGQKSMSYCKTAKLNSSDSKYDNYCETVCLLQFYFVWKFHFFHPTGHKDKIYVCLFCQNNVWHRVNLSLTWSHVMNCKHTLWIHCLNLFELLNADVCGFWHCSTFSLQVIFLNTDLGMLINWIFNLFPFFLINIIISSSLCTVYTAITMQFTPMRDK